MIQATSRRSSADNALVIRLSPRQVQTIGGFICGGDEAFEYRRMVDIGARACPRVLS